VNCTVRPMRGRDLWPVLAIERQAFPDDPWTADTAGGWLARLTRGGRARHAAGLARAIRFVRLKEAMGLAKLTRLMTLGQPHGLHYIVAEAGAQIAGYACLTTEAGGEAWIGTIAVRPEHRGQKIGSQLLSELSALAAASACREMFLDVRADNTGAHRLYQRTGFTDARIRPGYFQPSGADSIVMRLPVGARSS
jgi:ribosomal-protein-alanine acetyltransferase